MKPTFSSFPLPLFLPSFLLTAGLIGCGSEPDSGSERTDPSSVTSTPTGGDTPPGGDTSTGGETPTGGDTPPGGETPTGTTPPMEFPCDVRAVLQTYCAGCHTGQTYAPFYATRAVLAASLGDGTTLGSRVATRVGEGTMPPVYVEARPTTAEQGVVINWVASGMPTGACGALTVPAR